jgi:hypothetical protein
MKRDWDVVRQVLSEIESGDRRQLRYSDSVDPIATEHAFLLLDAGYITAIDATTLDGRGLINPELTWEGHDLLDTIRSKSVWERVKQLAKEKGVELTLDSVKLLAAKALDMTLAG